LSSRFNHLNRESSQLCNAGSRALGLLWIA